MRGGLGRNIMSEGSLIQWSRMFKDGREMFTMKREVIGRPFVASDYLFQNVDQKNCERCRFKISENTCQFPQISLIVL
jgi:hypothetical protein